MIFCNHCKTVTSILCDDILRVGLETLKKFLMYINGNYFLLYTISTYKMFNLNALRSESV